jgi:uncharacterized protein
MLVAIFNALMLAVDLAVLAWLARRRNLRALGAAAAVTLLAIGVISVGVSAVEILHARYSAIFLLFGLVTWGIFLHGAGLLLASGAILAKKRPVAASLCFFLALLLGVVIVDALWIEPHRLEITHHEIATTKITRPVRIVVLADIQTDSVGEYEREVFRAAKAEGPDLILLPGDYVHVRGDEPYRRQIELLHEAWEEAEITAPLGIIAVGGNTDRSMWPEIFADLGVRSVVSTETIETGEVVVTALSSSDSFYPRTGVAEREPFHIVVGHSPNFALGDIHADLLLAGHTHGGQIQIPGFGPLLTLSAAPRAWCSGRTTLEGDRTLIVSRGIGLERVNAPRVRLFCRPEIVVIDLVPMTP